MKTLKLGFLFIKKFLFSNLLFFVLGYGTFFFFTFLKVPLITNLFTPVELGSYAIIVSSLNYIEVLFFSWINGTIWRHVYDENFKSFGGLAVTLLPFITLMIILAAFFTFLVSYLLNIDNTKILITAFFSSLSVQLISVYLNYLLFNKNIKSWCFTIVLQSLGSFILLLILAWVYKLNIIGIFLSTLLCNAAIIIFQLSANFKKIKIRFVSFNSSVFKTLFSYSFFLTALSIFLTVLNNGDRFIIDYYKGKQILGQYSQNYNLASIGLFGFIQFFNTVFIPAYNKNLALKSAILTNEKIIQLYVLLFSPFLIFLLVNSSFLTDKLLGREFRGFSNIFNWVAAGIYFFGLSNFFEIRLKFLNKTKFIIACFAFVALLSLLLNSILLLNNSIEFAAIITFASYSLILICLIGYDWSFFLRLKLFSVLVDLTYATILYLTLFFLINRTDISDWGLVILNGLAAVLVYAFCLRKYYGVLKDCILVVNR